ncbi:hypothetical protein PVAND_007030 [Polypedilum vanderplanki]|uniref:Uncharacterized protein n=1 Tax=Polypedilum vanderplanki TaxID=319348 RepID=A0A9J6C603_POLVA|nr:hypothetical protein PVAND_007030 [Polypedilum vanderplanki]
MSQLTVNSVLLVLLHLIITALANVKITPIAVNSKSNENMKSDLKVEEARFRDPVMPEYYDRNRQGFVTSPYDDNYGGSAFDRYGYSNYYNRINSGSYGGYGSKYGYDNKFGGIYSGSSLENKFNQLTGYGNKFGYGSAGPVYGPYGNPSPISGGSFSGLLPPELEAKGSILLPLAGAALLGIAAYALVSNPGIATAGLAGPAIGKRRKRSLFDEKVEQHLAYRAHKKQTQKQ